MKRATQRLNREIEQDLAAAPAATAPAASVAETFRIVVNTQVYENYGAHGWDGPKSGSQCPQYWKAKGGNEYVRDVGSIREVLQLGAKGIARIADEMCDTVQKYDYAYQEYPVSWSLVSSTEETWEETELREMVELGIISEEIRQKRLKFRFTS